MSDSRGGRSAAVPLVSAGILATLSLPLMLSEQAVWRIPIAPVWAAASHWSSAASPSPGLVWVLLFAGLAATFYFIRPLFPPAGLDTNRARRILSWHLVVFYVVIALELVFFRRIANELSLWAGVGGDVGTPYLVFLAIRLIPGAMLFAVVATVVAMLIAGHRPERLGMALEAIWAANFILLAMSVIYCSRPSVG